MKSYDLDTTFSQEYHWLTARLYEHFFHEGRYVFVDKGRFSTLVQTQLKVDVIGQSAEMRSIGIEEKIVRWPGYVYDKFFLETDSCTNLGRESKGWMHDGQADYLLYAFETEEKGLDAYLIRFQLLKTWFWNTVNRAPNTYREHTMSDTINHTRGRLVPILDVLKNIPATKRYYIAPDGNYKRIATSLTTGKPVVERTRQEFDEAS